MFARKSSRKKTSSRRHRRIRNRTVIENVKRHIYDPVVEQSYLNPDEHGHIRSRSSQFTKLVNKKEFSDTEIRCPDGALWAIWAIIATSGSKFFKTMDASDKSDSPFEISRDDEDGHRVIESPIETKVMLSVLTFMYTGRFGVGVFSSGVTPWVDLVIAADFLQYKEMLNLLAQVAQSSPFTVNPNAVSSEKVHSIAKSGKALKSALDVLTSSWSKILNDARTTTNVSKKVGSKISPETILVMHSKASLKLKGLHRVLPIRTRVALAENDVFVSLLLDSLGRSTAHLFLTMPLDAEVAEMALFRPVIDPTTQVMRLSLIEAAKTDDNDGADDDDESPDEEIFGLDED